MAAEFIASNHLGQIAMGGDNQTDVDLMCAAAAQALELSFLQNAQNFRLTGHVAVPNFVKKEGTGVRHFESAVSSGAASNSLCKPHGLQQTSHSRTHAAIIIHNEHQSLYLERSCSRCYSIGQCNVKCCPSSGVRGGPDAATMGAI